MVETSWNEFLNKMGEVCDLGSAVAILTWDQETYMPRKGMAARGEQLATLQGLLHEKTVTPEWDALLSNLAAQGGLSDEQRAIIRTFEFDRERAVKLPTELVKETARAQATALSAWGEARRAKDFRLFAPALSRLLELRREAADAYGAPPGGERYDALLEGHEKGMRVARLSPIFESLRDWLVPAIQKISDVAPPPSGFLEGAFDGTKQWEFTFELLRAMGFDLDAGRQDRSVHPFTTRFDPEDVRITTRKFEN